MLDLPPWISHSTLFEIMWFLSYVSRHLDQRRKQGRVNTPSSVMGYFTHISLPHSLYLLTIRGRMSLVFVVRVDLGGILLDWELGCSPINKSNKIKKTR